MCSVFAPGIDPKTGDTLDPGDPVPGNTSSKSPLIVVAPEADGELRCCFVFPCIQCAASNTEISSYFFIAPQN